MKTIKLKIFLTSGSQIDVTAEIPDNCGLSDVARGARADGFFLSDALYVPYENILFLALENGQKYHLRVGELN